MTALKEVVNLRVQQMLDEMKTPNQVREELGLDVVSDEKKGSGRKRRALDFDVNQYYKWKEMGWTDVAIAKELWMSTSTLTKMKKELGIPTKKIKRITNDLTHANKKRMVMFKLNNYNRVRSGPVLEVIETLEKDYNRLQKEYTAMCNEKADEISRLQAMIRELTT